MHVAVCFTNFGPYHLARLRALGLALRQRGWRLSALELAGRERRYPWEVRARAEPFDWVTLFPRGELESINAARCRTGIWRWLNQAQPDVVFVAGYSRPESLAGLRWARRHGKASVLMSESQAIDKRRVWWKESIKQHRVALAGAALVGGHRHRDYLVELGMPASRIALGYNAVDSDQLATDVDEARGCAHPAEIPSDPYFLAVNRFVPEKNLSTLLTAYAAYRRVVGQQRAWALALCGDGEERPRLADQTRQLGVAQHVFMPGFLQLERLIAWYAHASAFVHPSLMEPWGLVVNEAAASALPLLVSDRCGCVDTFVPDDTGVTGYRFDPTQTAQLARLLVQMTNHHQAERDAMGAAARTLAREWGPARFARGAIEAAEIALSRSTGSLVGRRAASQRGTN